VKPASKPVSPAGDPVEPQQVADLGLSIRDVTQLLQTAVAGSKAGEYRAGGNSYRILVQLKDAEQTLPG
jgi:HAE1 family hydrophobic/amphiphilic exporter-1